MTSAQRVGLAIQMSEEAREITATGIRARHPEYAEHQVWLALVRLVLGDELFKKAFPREPMVAP